MRAGTPVHGGSLRRMFMAGRRLGVFVPVVLAFSLAVAGQGESAKLDSRLDAAAGKTLAQGHDAYLPPHISHLLGISSDEQQVAVKQFVEMKDIIRGFDVAAWEHTNIVIFVENRADHESLFYLTSPAGKVRKVLLVKAGVGYDRAPNASDRKAFEKEKQYWLDRLAPEHQ